MTIRLLFLSLLIFFIHLELKGVPPATNNHIKVDQFGYRCQDEKIAVISNPVTGFNSGSPFAPGTGTNQYQIRHWYSDEVVHTGTLTSWQSGATHTQSGDQVWWFDFSAFDIPGVYYVFDVVNNVGSYKFEIRDNIYTEPLKHAVRSYFYQRCGFAKSSTYAGPGWADGASHVGISQDTDCRLYNNTDPSTSKNLSGGWYDAGDYNKYVNFAWAAVHDLLYAYEENPTVWEDNYNIPESGNGIPDLIDELKFEFDWLLKMQNSNGSVLSVIGGGYASPPSADSDPRYYGPATTSASFSAASMFAHGAIVFKSLGIPAMTTYGNTLQTAAVNAWTWASSNPNITFYNSGILAAGEQEFSSGSYSYMILMRQLCAASYLYALTGGTNYKNYVEANYQSSNLYDWSFAYPFQSSEQDAMLYYTKASGITSSVGSTIQARYSGSVSTHADHLGSFTNKTDAYRAYLKDNDYTWGSNSIKCKQGSMFMSMNQYGLNSTNAENYFNAASGFIHYMHGINPMALVYLSNMEAHGAENSIREFYHGWFTDGSLLWDRAGTSLYGPPPGYVPGGPNPSWALAGCCPSDCGSIENNALCVISNSPAGQPIQKAYKDWNSSWPQNSWEITENAIYYNASYIRLLSKFISSTETCGNLNTNISSEKISPELEVNVFPNPFSHQTTIDVRTPRREKIQLRILSVHGKELLPAREHYTNEPLELGQELGTGVMILEIKRPHTLSILRLIKN